MPRILLPSAGTPSTISRTHVLSKRAPKLSTNKTLTFWRKRTQRRALANCRLTPADRLVQAKKREQRRHEYHSALQEAQEKIYALAQGLKDRFGKYSVEHYHNDLIHRAHKSRSTRKVNRWNAFQKLELKRMREERDGEINLTEATKEISTRWKALSQEERIAVTTGSMQEIEDERETKCLASYNVPLRTFHDARATIQSVEKQLSQLHARTGLEFLLMGCRSNTADFVKPFAYYSSEVVKGFISDSLNRSMDDLAIHLEAYVMSGLKGMCVAGNSKTKVLELKKRTAKLILDKLRTVTGGSHTRMPYDRFDELITGQYSVVVKGWPLSRFCNPSAVTSRIELELLYNAWQTGTTFFQKLGPEEMEVWENNRFSSRMALMPPPAEPIAALTLSPTPEASQQSQIIPFPEPAHQNTLEASTNAVRDARLTSIENLTGGSTSSPIDPHPPAPDSSAIARMIQADPTLQNVDPALIALGIMQGYQSPPTAMTTPAIMEASDRTPRGNSSKRSRQEFEVVTPLSYDARTAKKQRNQRNRRRPQETPAVQGVENAPPT